MSGQMIVTHSATPSPMPTQTVVRKQMSFHGWLNQMATSAAELGLITPQAPLRQVLADERYSEIMLLTMLGLDPQLDKLANTKLPPRLLEQAKRTCAKHGTLQGFSHDDSEDLLSNLFNQNTNMIDNLNRLLVKFDEKMEKNGLVYPPYLYRLIHKIAQCEDSAIRLLWHASGFPEEIRFTNIERTPLPLLPVVKSIVQRSGAKATWEYNPHAAILTYTNMMRSAQDAIQYIRDVLKEEDLNEVAPQLDPDMQSRLDALQHIAKHPLEYTTQPLTSDQKLHYGHTLTYLDAIDAAYELIITLQGLRKRIAIVSAYYDAVADGLLHRSRQDAFLVAPHRSLWSSPWVRSLYILCHPSPTSIPFINLEAMDRWHEFYASALYWAKPMDIGDNEVGTIAHSIVKKQNPQNISKDGQALARAIVKYSSFLHLTLSERMQAFIEMVAQPFGMQFVIDEKSKVYTHSLILLLKYIYEMANMVMGDEFPSDAIAAAHERAMFSMLAEEKLSRQAVGSHILQTDYYDIPFYTAHSLANSNTYYDAIIVLSADHDSWLRDPRGNILNVENYVHMLRMLAERAGQMYLIGSRYDSKGVKAQNDLLASVLTHALANRSAQPQLAR